MKPIDEIERIFSQQTKRIDQWISDKCVGVDIPLYTSVDLRMSSFKLAPVDTNIFPSGFNNLSEECRVRTAELFKGYFLKHYPQLERILIIPELHTRNAYYWESIFVLQNIMERVGYSVRVGLVSEELRRDEVEFEKLSEGKLKGYKLRREGNRVSTPGFEPDLLLVNNDFSAKCPEILMEIAQPVEPPVELGWHTRRKDVHFEFYNALVGELADRVGVDPWLVSMPARAVHGVSLDNPQDREGVAQVVEEVLQSTRRQYQRYARREKPFAVIKSNAGTYGMAVMSVEGPEDVLNLNLGGRKRMRVTKGGVPVRDVVVQEGVPTSLNIDHTAAEPVAYLVEANIAGAFLRHNRKRGERDNLNTPGMAFSPIECIYDEEGSRYFPFAAQVISRVASLAAGYEIEKIMRENRGCREHAS